MNCDLDPWYLENLICPVDGQPLRHAGAFLIGASGTRYPIVEGLPVMLRADVKETIGIAKTSLQIAMRVANDEHCDASHLYLETIGVTEAEREIVRDLYRTGAAIDPVASVLIGATSGYSYKHLIGKGADYAIPAFRFPQLRKGTLLDIGCNWGRWTVAATLAGYDVIGIDPSLGAVLAARRVAKQLGLSTRFVVGDARYLPFRADSFENAWSYSVLQHFSREDTKASLSEVARVVKKGGTTRIQMANALGIRSFYHMARRRFSEPRGFDVRYWSPAQLSRTYSAIVGPTRLDADCFLGLGLQWSDYRRLTGIGKMVLTVSELMRRVSHYVYPLRWCADSLFCTSTVR